MFITKKFALKKTRMHSDDTSISDPTGVLPWIDVKAYAPKGTVYYQISNGTIGRGAHYRNYSEKAMAALMSAPATAWKQGIGSIEQEVPKVELKLIKSVIETIPDNPYTIESDRLFTYDDIPF